MTCRLVKRYMGGSLNFGLTTTNKITLDNTDGKVFNNTDFTIACWYKPTSLGSGSIIDYIFSHSEGGGNGNRIYLQILSNLKIGAVCGAGGITTTRTLVPGNWYYIIADYERATRNVSIKVNDVLWLNPTASNGSTQTSALSTTAFIGNQIKGATLSCHGKLAEFITFERLLTDTEKSNLYKYAIIPEGNIKGKYLLDDVGATAVDTSGNGNDGTITGATYSPDVPTQLPVAIDTEARSSLSFDGVDDKVTFTPITVPVYTGSATLDIYLKRLGAGDMCLFGYDQTAYKFLTWYAGGGIVLETNTNNDAATASSGYALLNPDFHRITCVSTLGVVKMFFDGQRIPMSDSSVSNDVTIDRIGLALTGFPLKALVKSARIWNTALTDQQIRDLHFSNIVPTDGLVLNLKLNEGAGTIAYDSSGNGNDGTITGATWSATLPPNAGQRPLVDGNLVKNGDFSYVPRVNVATTTNTKWIDGTAGGSSSLQTAKLFGYKINFAAGSGAAMFDTSVLYNGKPTLKVSTTATGSDIQIPIGSFAQAEIVQGYSIKIKPSTSYKIRYTLKTSPVTGDATTGAVMGAYQYTSAGAYINSLGSYTAVKVAQDFTVYEVTFSTGGTGRWVTPYCRVKGNDGTATLIMDAWFADISLTETTLPTSTVATTRTTLTCP